MHKSYIQFKKDHPFIFKGLFIVLLVVSAFLITQFFCFPYSNGKLHLGADVGFHMNRFFSLAIAMKNDDVYPYLNWYQNYGFGYPTPMFYCNIMLYLPAYFLLQGMDIVPAYKLFVTILIFIAVLMMGILISKVSKYKFAPFIGMLVFILNTHSITDILRRGGLGELLALVFIPFILIGIYNVLYKDYTKWFVLAFGFCGLVLSHNITFLLMVFLFGVFILINIKTLIKEKKRLLSILAAGISAFCCSVFFLLPMLEQMNAIDMVVSHASDNIVLQGSTLAELFNFDTSTNIYLNGSIGPFLIFLPLSAFIFPKKLKKNPFVFHCLVIGYVLYICMSNLFPWQWMQFLVVIQFVQRFLPLVICLLAIATGHYIAQLCVMIKNYNVRYVLRFATCTLVVGVSFFMLLVNYNEIEGYTDDLSLAEVNQPIFDSLQENAMYNVQELSSGDYLPYNTSISYRDYDEWTKWSVSKSTSIIDTDKKAIIDDKDIRQETYNHYQFKVKYASDDTLATVPRTYYLGYHVYAYDSNDQLIKELEISPREDNGLIQFELINSDEEIMYDVTYEPTELAKNSMNFSITFAKIFVVGYAIYRLVLFYYRYKLASTVSKQERG